MEDMLYTVAEVAKILKVNVTYVHSLRKANLLPFLKLGSYKCRKIALEKFLADYEGMDVTDPSHVTPLQKESGVPLGKKAGIVRDVF